MFNKTRLCIVTGVITSSIMALAVNAANARDLTVVSWGGNFQDAQREIFFKPYAKETGKRVLDETWDGGYGVLQAKVQAGTPNWDVVQVEAEELALGCSDGIYEKIDWDMMGGQDAYIPAAVSECGVGDIVWSTGLAYDGDKFKSEKPETWGDFWDVKKFPGKRGLRKGAKYALEFALQADGVKLEDVYEVLLTPKGVDRAFKKLDELRDDIVWWDSAAQALQLLSSGEVAMSAAFNGRITGLNRSEGKNFVFVFPGSIYAVDSWVVLKGSPNRDEAMEFIAYSNQPENMAKLPEFIAYGLPRLAAGDLIPEKYRAELPTSSENIENALALDSEFWTDNGETLTQRFNAWVSR